MKTLGLVLLVLQKDGGPEAEPDAFGAFIGKNTPVEVAEGVSWRDALAEERARVNALEDALGSLGYEVHYCEDVDEVAKYDDVKTLIVNDTPWDLPEDR